MQIEEVVGRRIREARDRAGMTQADLGRELGRLLGRPWSRQAMSAAEKGGRSFNVVELVAIASVLGTTVTSLVAPGPETSDEVSPLTFPSGEVLTTEQFLRAVLHLPGDAREEQAEMRRQVANVMDDIYDASQDAATLAERLQRAMDAGARLMYHTTRLGASMTGVTEDQGGED